MPFAEKHYYSGKLCTKLKASLLKLKQTNEHNMIKNPNWPEADQLTNLQSVAEELNLGLPRTNPVSGMVENFNPRPPDYKTSALKPLGHAASRTLSHDLVNHKKRYQKCVPEMEACTNIVSLFVKQHCF